MRPPIEAIKRLNSNGWSIKTPDTDHDDREFRRPQPYPTRVYDIPKFPRAAAQVLARKHGQHMTVSDLIDYCRKNEVTDKIDEDNYVGLDCLLNVYGIGDIYLRQIKDALKQAGFATHHFTQK